MAAAVESQELLLINLLQKKMSFKPEAFGKTKTMSKSPVGVSRTSSHLCLIKVVNADADESDIRQYNDVNKEPPSE